MSYPQNADIIDDLPTDHTVPSHSEINIVNNLFKENKSGMYRILHELKTAILIGVLFIIFSIPHVDDLIKRIIPSSYAGSIYILLLVKAILLVIVFYFINNFYIMKTN